jgi:excisionase family DNA binding protein
MISNQTVMAPAYCCKEPLTLKEAAQYTGLAQSYLYQLVREKRIPHYKPLCGKLYFKKSELEAFIFKTPVAIQHKVAAAADAILNGET